MHTIPYFLVDVKNDYPKEVLVYWNGGEREEFIGLNKKGHYLLVQGKGEAQQIHKLNNEKLINKIDQKFTKYEQDGIVIIIDKKSDLYIDGTVIDWYSELTKQGFTFTNPNANKTCGCGSSFSV